MARHSLDRYRRTLLAILVSTSLAATPPSAVAGVEEARTHYDAGDLKTAAIELKKVLEADDGNVEARILLARVYLDLRAGTEAEKELRRAEDLGANPARLRTDLADAMLMQNRFLDALRSLEGAGTGATGAEKAALAVRRGLAYAGLNEAEAARRSIEDALKLDPSNEEANLGKLVLQVGELGEGNGAETLVAAFLEKFPDNVDALLMSAELHRAKQDFAAALVALDRVLTLRPQDLRARHGRAGVLIAQGKPEEAKAELDRAEAVRAGLVMTEYLRGVIALQEKDHLSADAHFGRVLRADPGHVQSQLALGTISFWRNDLKSSEEYLDRALLAMPDELVPEKIHALKMLGIVRLKSEQPEKAIEVLAPVAARSNDARLMALLGRAYLANGEPDQGLEWLSRAAEIAPDIEVGHAYAMLALQLGRTTEALDRAKKLQQDLPDSRAGWDLEGEIYLRLQRPELAVNAFEAANRLESSGAGALALALAYAESKQHLDAMATLETWLEEQPGDAPVLGYLAELQMQQGQIREAISTYERLVSLSPAMSTALNNLAWLYQEVGDGRALELARRAHELAPTSPAVTDTYGWVLLESGETEEALSVFQDAHRAHPTSTTISYHLAVALNAAGRREEAVDVLRELLRESPDSAQAKAARTLLEEIE